MKYCHINMRTLGSCEASQVVHGLTQRKWKAGDSLCLQVVGFIIGKKGVNKANIERETGAAITISSKSRRAEEQADVMIKASSTDIAESAADRIRLAIEDAITSNRCLRSKNCCKPRGPDTLTSAALNIPRKPSCTVI